GVRAISHASISDSVVTGCAALSPRVSACMRFFTPPESSVRVSSKVFQAAQWGHLPSHLGLLPAHSEQTKVVLSRAMLRTRPGLCRCRPGWPGIGDPVPVGACGASGPL